MSYQSYQEYIRSDAWRDVKRRYRASRLPQTCYVCGSTPVDLHHRTYKRLGQERLSDLVPLCPTHHQAAHALLRRRRAAGANPSKVNYRTIAHILKRQEGKSRRILKAEEDRRTRNT